MARPQTEQILKISIRNGDALDDGFPSLNADPLARQTLVLLLRTWAGEYHWI